MDYLELMRGAGLGDVLAPKEEFMKEHERLVALLGDPVSGGSNKSNFIARLMAEQKYKHATGADRKPAPYRPGRKDGRKTSNPTKGVYRKPVMDPDVDETEMRAPIKFDYNKLAFKRQDPRGRDKTEEDKHEYGASPFIAHHFGNVRSRGQRREDEVQKAARRYFSGKPEKAEEEEEEEEEREEETEAERKERAKEQRQEALEEFRRKKKALSIEERLEKKDIRKPESIKRAERKKRAAEKRAATEEGKRGLAAAIEADEKQRREDREAEERRKARRDAKAISRMEKRKAKSDK
jgi:hypothetical protein